MDSYAIIQAGGKQYRVQKGDVIDVELMTPDQNTVQFKNILFFHDGKKETVIPAKLAKAQVQAEVLGEVRGPKIVSFKYKQRKSSTRRKVGHRQNYLRVRITDLSI